MTLRYAWHKPPTKATSRSRVTQSEAPSCDAVKRRLRSGGTPPHTGRSEESAYIFSTVGVRPCSSAVFLR
jgi:hypothetical protein